MFLPKRTPLSEHVHFGGGTGQHYMALSAASCRQLSVFDTRESPHNFVLQPIHGDGLPDDYECFRTLGLHPLQTQRVCGTSCVQGRVPSELRDGSVSLRRFALPLAFPQTRKQTVSWLVLDCFFGGVGGGGMRDKIVATQCFYSAFA